MWNGIRAQFMDRTGEHMVSIIIPTYKGEAHIVEAVLSVLQQTYSDIEVIVVDDNGRGTEHQVKTQELLSGFSSDSRFYYIAHEKNKNGSAARNTGIHASHGEYLGFLDDDDRFLPEKIERQVALFESLDEEYGLVYGSFREQMTEKTFRTVQAEECDDFLFRFLCDEVIACSSTVLIRRGVLSKVVEWDETFRRHQDLEFFARVASMYKVAFVSEVCVEKRKLDRNTPNGKVYEDYHLHYMEKMKPIIEQYSEEKQRYFYDHHYFEMGKMHIKSKNFARALYWAGKSSRPIRMLGQFGAATFDYLIRKSKG